MRIISPVDFTAPLVVSQHGRWHHYRRAYIERSDTKRGSRSSSRIKFTLFIAPSFVGTTWGLRVTVIMPFKTSASNDLIVFHQRSSLKGLTSSHCKPVQTGLPGHEIVMCYLTWLCPIITRNMEESVRNLFLKGV